MPEQQPWVEIKQDTLYAFWSHDNPPFLGGTVTKIRNDGAVETSEFGPQQWFRPVCTVPYARGKAIQAKLEEMRGAHRAATTEFNAGWRVTWRAVAREYGLPEPK